MSEEKKTYIKGSAREYVFDGGGSLINFSVNVVQLAKLAGLRIEEPAEKNDEYVNLTMRENINGKDEYGNTHNVQLNTFKPITKAGGKKPASKKADETDGLPF